MKYLYLMKYFKNPRLFWKKCALKRLTNFCQCLHLFALFSMAYFNKVSCFQGSFNKIMIFSSKNHLKVWLIKLLCLLLCYTLLSHWNLFYTRLLSQRISYFHHIWRIFHYNDNKWDPMINRWSEFVLTSLKVTLEQDNIKKRYIFRKMKTKDQCAELLLNEYTL